MQRTEVVYISFEELVQKMKATEDELRNLPDSVIRTLLITATISRAALNRDANDEATAILLRQMVLQLNWLAEAALVDSGLLTEEERLPAFHAVTRNILQIEDNARTSNARAKMTAPPIGSDYSKDN